MPNGLRDILKTAGGQLVQTSAEELAFLTGRDAAPITPLETGVIGGTADQAKMAGTSAQKVSALRQAIQGEDDLATRQRREQVRRAATAEEQQQRTRGERLQRLGDLESRVEQLAEQAITAGAGQTQQLQLQAIAEDQQVTDLLNRIRDNPADTQAIAQLYQNLGMERAGEIIAADGTLGTAAKSAILEGYGGGESQVAQALASSVQDKIATGELNFQDMGFTDANEVAELLGTDANTLSNYSIAQLVQEIQSAVQMEHSAVEDLQRRANDPALGAAERAEARRSLREAGAVGIRAIESEMDDLADEIAEANTVEFLGEEKTIEELLDNEFIAGIAKDYFEEPGFKEDLEKTEPALAEFIERHQGLLESAAGQVEEGLRDFARIQYDNQQLKMTEVGPIPDDVMKAWFPEWGEISADRYEQPDIVKALHDPSYTPVHKTSLMQAIQDIGNKAPKDFIQELSDLTETEIANAGLLDTNSPEYHSLMTRVDMANQLGQVLGSNPQGTARLIGASSTQNAEEAIKEAQKRIRSGFFEAPGELQKLEDILPIDKDPDTWTEQDWGQINQALREEFVSPSLRDVIRKGPAPNYAQAFGDVQVFNNKKDYVYDTVSPAFENDNRIDASEISDIASTLSVGNIENIFRDSRATDKMEPGTRAAAVNIIADQVNPAVEQKLVDTGKFGEFGHFAELVNMENPESKNSMLKKDVYEHFRGAMTQYITEVENLVAESERAGNSLTQEAYQRKLDEANGLLSQYDRNWRRHRLERAEILEEKNRRAIAVAERRNAIILDEERQWNKKNYPPERLTPEGDVLPQVGVVDLGSKMDPNWPGHQRMVPDIEFEPVDIPPRPAPPAKLGAFYI